jgi:hypothetical protein
MLLRILLAAVIAALIAGPICSTAKAAPPTKTVTLDIGGLH